MAPADAAALLSRSGGLAYPTGSVCGLGCDPLDQAAVLRVLAMQQRSVDKGLILVASQWEQLRPCLDLAARRRLRG
ncbi:MAG: Sua5/YciO/YrdC/YwlC family protein [Pseudoxanthomonas sp.]|nr:Sua5/YciO/YrdC/YwlC family protein [Pseudoxanthomonas sp.]